MKVRAVGVVVPARDEETTVGECVRAIAVADRWVDVDVLCVVVADHCVDATAARAAAGGATVLVRRGPSPERAGRAAGSVGVARALGSLHVLRRFAPLPYESIWLAHTDADSRVRPDWLRVQLGYAEQGFGAVAGRVSLGHDGHRDVHRRWTAAYSQRNGHVHGANLGVRADHYLAAGGFAPVSAHEDLGLVQRLLASGCAVARPRDPGVLTSARLAGRAVAGVAADLRTLG